ncbi:hypothetical protein [Photobacterium kishitanii]|nr:hypothetical protein [Photobacterium kishitanii]
MEIISADSKVNKEERFVLTHGTSAYDFIYSLSEGGKPATSLALGKVTNPKDELTDELKNSLDKSLKKFGDIVVALSPESVFDDEMAIYTRDSYTRDAPKKVIVRLSEFEVTKLQNRLQEYIELTNRDILRTIKLDFKADREIGLNDLCSKLSNDPALMMLFLEKKGISIELPRKPLYTPSEMVSFFIKHVNPSILNGESLQSLSDVEKSHIIEKYNNYHQEHLDHASTKFQQNMFRHYLGMSDDNKLSDALDGLTKWVKSSEKPEDTAVDKHELKNRVLKAISEFGDIFYKQEVLKIANNIGEHFIYTADDEAFLTKEESWDYMTENSGMQSQQSLGYSQNEIFSLKSEELKPDEIYANLDLIDPLKFTGVDGSDAVSSDYTSDITMVDRFGKAYTELMKKLGISSDTSAFEKEALSRLVLDTPDELNFDSLTKIYFSVKDENKEDITRVISELKNIVGSLLPDELDAIKFNNAYHHVRNLKSDLDSALDMYKMPFDDGREFYKTVFPWLTHSGNAFNYNDIIEERQNYVYGEGLESREEEITAIVDELSNAFDSLPNEVPYFELVTKKTLHLDSSLVHSIHVPIELTSLVEHLNAEYPSVMSKVKFYDNKQAGALTQSIINSGASIAKESLNPENRRVLKSELENKVSIKEKHIF